MRGFEPLAKGDKVELVMPSSACTEEEYNNCVEYIHQLGLVAKYRKYSELVSQEEILYSNTPLYRADHLYDALTANDSKAVWDVKGGYGSAKLLASLKARKKPDKAKLFIGFSDATILLNFLVNNWQIACIHGPLLFQLPAKVTEESAEIIKEIIFGKVRQIEIAGLEVLNTTARNYTGNISSSIIGGCLSLVQSLIGTDEFPQVKGKILFLEDIGEAGARIDRMLDHLSRVGVFDKLKAVLLGNFMESNSSGSPKAIEVNKAISNLANLLDEKNIPLLQSLRLGHTKDIVPLPFGTKAILTLGKQPKLQVATGI